MIHINELLFNKKAITTADVTSDVIDAGANNIGDAMRLEIQIVVNETFVAVSGDTPTLTFHLQDCATETGSFEDVLVTKTFAVSELVKGNLIKFGIPTPIRRYYQLVADKPAAGDDFSAGRISAFHVSHMF